MEEIQRFDRFEVRPGERQLLIDGRAVAIGARAFDVLQALIERRDRVVTKRELLDIVWTDVVVEESNLAVHVSALRKLLGSNVIATIPGRGYRFVAPSEVAVGPTASSPPSVAPDSGNLPLRAPPLIGRDAALRELLDCVGQHPLVTIVGAGGIGKTALALAAALALRGRFRDGVWWVELAPLGDPALLPQTVAQALRITLASRDSATTVQQQLVGVLRSQKILLVLDNCEHVVDAVSRLAAAIGAEALGVHTLATSQEQLGVHGEHVFQLGSLSVPASGETPHVETHGAVALFVERTRAVSPHFCLTAENAAAVSDICRRLDGLPLAIELAAARVRLLGVQGLRDRLGDCFKVLVGGARTALPRHQTLRATFDWSHALLKAEEQAVLRRLGVFVGGFSLTLAQEVAADERIDVWAVLDALGTLIDKSVVAADAGEPVRYRLLETTRVYALERLAEHDETARCLQRHAHAVRDLFVHTNDERFGDGGKLDMESLIRRLGPELDNWRAAFDWAVGDGAEPATAIALAGAGSVLLDRFGLAQEALDRMLPLRAMVNDDIAAPRAAVFWLRLAILGTSGRLPRDTLIGAQERGLRLCRAIGSRRLLCLGLSSAAWSLNMLGEFAAAEAMVPEIAALERADDPAWLRCNRLNLQAAIYHHQDRIEEAVSVLKQQHAQLLLAPGEGGALSACRSNLSVMLNCLERHSEAIALALSALQHRGASAASSYVLFQVLHAQVALNRIVDAQRTLSDAVPIWRRDALLLFGGFAVAELLASCGRKADAARVEAAATSYMRRTGARLQKVQQLARGHVFRALDAAGVARADIERWRHEGELLDEDQVAAICESVVVPP